MREFPSGISIMNGFTYMHAPCGLKQALASHEPMVRDAVGEYEKGHCADVRTGHLVLSVSV
jgi:hypothetical protein